jgi:hypothetical protein
MASLCLIAKFEGKEGSFFFYLKMNLVCVILGTGLTFQSGDTKKDRKTGNSLFHAIELQHYRIENFSSSPNKKHTH